ncbi:MAG: HAD family hydrolase [Actinobacteria bacterium]|nr:HAD family hydrolase [Actinomycetota bacterium]
MPAVLFDIDGTLTDTNYLHVRAWRLAFTSCGEDVASARIHRMIGAGSGVLMRELLGEERKDVKDCWREEFDRLKAEIAPFPAAADLLRAVSGLGIDVVLATSSEPADAEALVAALEAGDAVAAVTHAGDVDEAKPSPEVFEAALAKAGCDTDDAVVVGDTVWDVEAAERCGLRCVTLLSGGISRAELEEAGALAVYEDPAHLLADLDRSPLARLGRR